jgi:hypothetical protein
LLPVVSELGISGEPEIRIVPLHNLYAADPDMIDRIGAVSLPAAVASWASYFPCLRNRPPTTHAALPSDAGWCGWSRVEVGPGLARPRSYPASLRSRSRPDVLGQVARCGRLPASEIPSRAQLGAPFLAPGQLAPCAERALRRRPFRPSGLTASQLHRSRRQPISATHATTVGVAPRSAS